MIQLLSLFFLLVFFNTALAAPIYKSEDESGNPVFSDKAPESAEQIEVKEPTTFKSSLYTRQYKSVTDKLRGNDSDNSDNFKYQTLAITSPENGTAIRDNAGNIELHYLVEPGIQQGHTIQLMMDGQVHSTVGSTGSVSIQNMDRGTHQFNLNVTRKDDGKVLQTGPTTSITMLRYSRQH